MGVPSARFRVRPPDDRDAKPPFDTTTTWPSRQQKSGGALEPRRCTGVENSMSSIQNSDEEPASGAPLRETPGILQLAWPAVVGNLLYSTVAMVDIKIVGSLGASAVAAVTTGNRIFFVFQAVIMATSVGTTALVARAWGAGDRDEAERITKVSVLVGAAVGLLLSVPGVLFSDVLASTFRLEAETVAQASEFIYYLSFFNGSFAIAMILGAAVRAAGDTLTPLWLGAITNVVNVILVYALVYGRFGAPELGVKGAALATGLAFTLAALLSIVFWLKGWFLVGYTRARSFSSHRIRQLFRIGYPSGIEQGAIQLGFILFLWIVSFYGTSPYAAYGIGVQILSFSFVVGFGFSIAASTHVGQQLGAADPAGATRSGWRALWLSVGIMVVLGSLIILFAEPIARFMIDDDEVVRLTVIFIYILGAMQPLMAVEFTLGGALRGAGDTRFPLLTTITGLLLVRGSVAGVFLWMGLAVEWVFAALIVDYIVKATMLVSRFRRGRWQTIEL
jgi:putative MATE family efflux protein